MSPARQDGAAQLLHPGGLPRRPRLTSIHPRSAREPRCDHRRTRIRPSRPATQPSHLTPERWAAANRHLVRKALAEFAHERILTPEPLGPDPLAAELARYRVTSDDGSAEYRFTARHLALDHWSIADMSIRRPRPGHIPTCPRRGRRMGMSPGGGGARRAALHHRVPGHPGDPRGDAPGLPRGDQQHAGQPRLQAVDWASPRSAELAAGVTGGADAAVDFQAIERSMTEGHPCFVANNGRLGFGIADYRAFAPETGAPVQARVARGAPRARPSSRPPQGLQLPEPPRRRTGAVPPSRLRRRAAESGAWTRPTTS